MKNIHNISAGAGSGKTTKLVEIISNLVEGKGYEKCPPERMILTTFTNAAAQEFKERTAAKLIGDGYPAEAATLDAAMIGTVHSVAQAYITRYWYMCGISPNVTPVTEEVSMKMRNRSLDAVTSADDVSFFRKYAEAFSITKGGGNNGTDYDFWKSDLSYLYAKTRLIKNREEFINDVRKHSAEVLDCTFTQEQNNIIIDEVFKKHANEYIRCSKVDDIHYSTKSVPKAERQVKLLEKILDNPSSFKKEDCESIKDDFDKPFSIKKAKKGEWETIVQEAFEGIIPGLEKLQPEETSLIAECTEKICKIALKWIENYDNLKKMEGVIDFDDMEFLFLELLGKEEILEDIRSSIDYLFVDEFQDSNPIQIKIFEILSDNVKQSWFVGDPKQAIYGFRGSDIQLVNGFTSQFPEVSSDENSFTRFRKDENGLSSEILDCSYRSHPSLVNLSNEVFRQAFKDDLDEQNIILKPGRGDQEDDVLPRIHHIVLEGSNKETQQKALSGCITRLLNGEYPGLEELKVKPSDIAVLVRSNENTVSLATVLKENGVPVSFADRAFLDSAEVSLITAILNLIAGKQVEKSEAELLSLIDGLELKNVLTAVKDGHKKPSWGGLSDFVISVRQLSAIDCVDAIVARFDLYNFVSRWNNADARRANIDLVRQIARQFDTDTTAFASASDISSFISYMERYDPEQKFNNEDSGVKVLTYHKAKGLEWKIVFLHDLSGDEDREVRGSDISGLNGKLFIPKLPKELKKWMVNAVETNEELNNLMNSLQDKAIGEERRLLYVGLTRARDFVFSVGYSGKGMKWLKRCCPSAKQIDYSTALSGEQDIWGVGMKSMCNACQAEDVKFNNADAYAESVKNAGFYLPEKDTSYELKYHNPSKFKDGNAIAASSCKELLRYPRLDIRHQHLEDSDFGDCIHKIFALGTHPDKEIRESAAARILEAYGLDKSHSSAIIERFDDLRKFLISEYGDPVRGMEHELPFVYQDTAGRVFNGEMDFVWKASASTIIVDYKTFSGTAETAIRECVENHASQIKIYRDALQASGENVSAVLIFYPIIGLIVKIIN